MKRAKESPAMHGARRGRYRRAEKKSPAQWRGLFYSIGIRPSIMASAAAFISFSVSIYLFPLNTASSALSAICSSDIFAPYVDQTSAFQCSFGTVNVSRGATWAKLARRIFAIRSTRCFLVPMISHLRVLARITARRIDKARQTY